MRQMRPPPIEAVLGSLVHAVTLDSVPVPDCLASPAERAALDRDEVGRHEWSSHHHAKHHDKPAHMPHG